ncbi:MAG TPA: hemolysin family protein [Roseiflexaceae bacterium]|nr:hemolysin family protein [Roseiflexaceae bacterium]
MDPDPSLYVIGVGLCLLVLAFTSAVDAALSAISRHRLNLLQSEDAPRARIVTRLLDDPYRFKSAVLFLNAAAMIAATAFTLRGTRDLDPGLRIGALLLLLLLALTLSEALPKALATRNPTRAANLLAGPMALMAWLLRPLVALIDLLTRPLFRLVSGQPGARTPLVTEEELRLLVNVGEEEGLIEPDERQMIEGIFSFGDTVVREVMIPRVDIVALESTATLDEALEVAIVHGYSRIPIFSETIDQIDGVLYIKDLLPVLRAGRREVALKELLRPAYFVPETMKVAALLKDLQTRKVRLALVVDEYGGTAGLATIEDLLEEIVGEIQDEYDAEEAPLKELAEGEVEADARVLLDDINDRTGLRLSSEESDRLGGLVYEQLGRVPKVGDLVQLPDGVTITVLSVEGLGPRRLRLSYQPNALAVSAPGEEATGDSPT